MIKIFRKLADFLEQERCHFKDYWNDGLDYFKIKKSYACKNCLCEKSTK